LRWASVSTTLMVQDPSTLNFDIILNPVSCNVVTSLSVSIGIILLHFLFKMFWKYFILFQSNTDFKNIFDHLFSNNNNINNVTQKKTNIIFMIKYYYTIIKLKCWLLFVWCFIFYLKIWFSFILIKCNYLCKLMIFFGGTLCIYNG